MPTHPHLCLFIPPCMCVSFHPRNCLSNHPRIFVFNDAQRTSLVISLATSQENNIEYTPARSPQQDSPFPEIPLLHLTADQQVCQQGFRFGSDLHSLPPPAIKSQKKTREAANKEVQEQIQAKHKKNNNSKAKVVPDVYIVPLPRHRRLCFSCSDVFYPGHAEVRAWSKACFRSCEGTGQSI